MIIAAKQASTDNSGANFNSGNVSKVTTET